MRQSNLRMAIARILLATHSFAGQPTAKVKINHSVPSSNNVKTGSNLNARSSFKQNRRLQMKTGN